jgi:hypothetical protein
MSPEPRAGGNRPLTALLSSPVRLVYGTVIDLIRRGASARARADLTGTWATPRSTRRRAAA